MLDFSQLFSHFLFWRLSSFFWKGEEGEGEGIRQADRADGGAKRLFDYFFLG